MRNYENAKLLADAKVTEISGYAGGKSRRISFHNRANGDVAAQLFSTDIVTWHADGTATVCIIGPNRDGAGFPGMTKTEIFATPSSFDGISAALDISRARVGNVKRVPYVNGHELSTGTATLSSSEIGK